MLIFAIIFSITWIIFLYFNKLGLDHLKSIDSFKSDSLLKKEDLPKLSIVIAVKDEAEEIEHTLTTLLSNKYPNLEVIIVNDRSTDGSGKIIEELSKKYQNLKHIHITELPSGWLGKVNALNHGVKLATGEYILFTDGDVEIKEEVLTKTVSIMGEKNLDHLTVIPEIPCPTFFLKLLVLTSKCLFTLSAKTWLSIEKRPVQSTKGIGPFNLVKRKSFEKTQGFEWLKMDVADDVALAQLMAENGGRSLYMQAGEHGPTFPWYRDAIHMMHGLEKNIVGGFTNYKYSLLLLVSTIAISTFLVPITLVLTGDYQVKIIGMALILTWPIYALLLRKHFHKFHFFVLAMFPLGIMLLAFILLRSAFICYKNGGIYWSGTFYPLKELKDGTRVKLGI